VTTMTTMQTLFSLQGSTAVITGGSGALGSGMARALASAGAHVAILSLHIESAMKVVETIRAEGGQAIGIACSVNDQTALEQAVAQITDNLGPVDLLVNAAGGNNPLATTSETRSFFDLDIEGVNSVLTLNLMGTMQSCRAFGRGMAERKHGCIINITSMSAIRPLTRIPAYSAAKAATTNFTQWLAVHMAQEYSPHIRVNAIAPGFFLTEQNRFLLTDAQSGELTQRGQTIINQTPMGRLGTPDDLIGALVWLASPASAFVTGIVVPVDGGFSSFGGV